MTFDLDTLRTVLLITLSILVVGMLFVRFRQRTLANDLPVLQHAELIELQVAYHPARIRVVVNMPNGQTLHCALLDTQHQLLHRWPDRELRPGRHVLEHELENQADGEYCFELSTATQRTLRNFRLTRA